MITTWATLAVLLSNPVPAADQAPDKMTVAVMKLGGSAGIDATLVTSLTGVVAQELNAIGAFRTISVDEINQMLSYDLMQQAVGCNDIVCFSEIAGALGTDYVVNGSVVLTGATHVLQLTIADLRRAQIAGRVTREYTGEAAGLLSETRTAVRALVRDLLANHTGALVLTVSEEGATVVVDDAIAGVTPLARVDVPAGNHVLQVTKPGFVVARENLSILSGKETSLSVTLLPSAEFAREYEEQANRTRILAWSAVGVGALAGCTAAALLMSARNRASDLNADVDTYNAQSIRTGGTYDDIRDRRSSIARIDAIGLVAGLVSLAAFGVGGTLFVTGDDPDRYVQSPDGVVAPASGAQTRLSVSGSGVSLAVGF